MTRSVYVVACEALAKTWQVLLILSWIHFSCTSAWRTHTTIKLLRKAFRVHFCTVRRKPPTLNAPCCGHLCLRACSRNKTPARGSLADRRSCLQQLYREEVLRLPSPQQAFSSTWCPFLFLWSEQNFYGRLPSSVCKLLLAHYCQPSDARRWSLD